MAYWTGLVLAAIAAGFLVAGWRRRQAVRAERVALGYAPNDDSPQRRDPYSSITILGDAVPPVVLAALAFVGVKSVFFYVALGGGIFSIADLAGFLMLLAGYGAWMWWHSRYRFAEPAELAPYEAAAAGEVAAEETAAGETQGGPAPAGPGNGDAPGRRRAA